MRHVLLKTAGQSGGARRLAFWHHKAFARHLVYDRKNEVGYDEEPQIKYPAFGHCMIIFGSMTGTSEQSSNEKTNLGALARTKKTARSATRPDLASIKHARLDVSDGWVVDHMSELLIEKRTTSTDRRSLAGGHKKFYTELDPPLH